MEKGSVICCRPYSHLPSIWNLFSTSLRPSHPNKVPIFRVFQRITWKTANNLIVRNMSAKGHVAEGVFSMSGEKEAYSASVVGKDKLLTDCGPDQECVLGGVVALGKFDALHIGHRELAIQASKAGAPFLLSFEGMAEVLGWEPRAPIVAKCDRKRVLSSWAPYCGGLVPQEYHVKFSAVRHLSPQQFVERLSRELQISGVVAGENYRFGYKASGDASELVRLCKEYGLEAYIVNPVMDMDAESGNGATQASTKEKVSSTRVRLALAAGDMEQVATLLGRKHRLVLAVSPECVLSGNNISLPRSCMLNQPPKDGAFEHCSLYVDDKFLSSCEIFLDSTQVRGEMESVDGFLVDDTQNYEHISIEFG